MTEYADPLAFLWDDATPAEAESFAEARFRLATHPDPRPPRVPMRRVLTVCSTVLIGEVAVMAMSGQSLHATLLPGYLILMGTFGLVFCLGAVTVAGFAAGVAAAALLVLEPGMLLPLLAGAALLAVACGIAPGWSRVEAWQATRSRPLTAEEEAAAAQRSLAGGRHRAWTPGVRLRHYWRADRVLAAFLVLAFPPCITAFSVWFIGWMAAR